jgi:hypothetical protein
LLEPGQTWPCPSDAGFADVQNERLMEHCRLPARFQRKLRRLGNVWPVRDPTGQVTPER